MSKAEHGGPNWKYTETRLMKKNKNLYDPGDIRL